MATPEHPWAGMSSAGSGLLGVLAALSTTAALVVTVQTPDDMVQIGLLYLVALAAGAAAVRLRRGASTNGLKLLVGTTVLACLVTLTLWTVLDMWSTMGRCERREQGSFLTSSREAWYEGSACTDEQREHFYVNM
ncbi:hypothetical protein LO763_25090 [Glycomyces sp. A-F 0318]|uniref:hypothetical protein n=1 Tax=Glycomyces amatae TaxID=2881355 RepID=UPI001E3A0B25|nr:hypothetical protein [Glycomyces amatae]MCD0446900.1 hypothetical protein [Glycomyces amatae]